MNKCEKYRALRAQYPVFEYVDYHYAATDEGLRLWFDFRMGDVEFHPQAVVERRAFLPSQVHGIDRLVFDIGMAELVSYWKCACPPTVRVLCGLLDGDEAAFWKKLYWHGLGEFFYTNGLLDSAAGTTGGGATFDDFMTLSFEGKPTDNQPLAMPCHPTGDDYLVPIGGGKDSVVTLELLRRAGGRVRPLIMNPRGATRECARVAGFPLDEVLVIRRAIDPTLLQLNAQGYLNGHTPFSAMLAFYTRLASRMSGVPNVALSNENSANESTVRGTTVNHQYSKSLEFEDDFRRYCGCSRQIFNYFSFLRPLTELQIAMLFSRQEQYHDVFRSCNVGSKEDIWCGHCAKCLFAYIILSPFIAPARLQAIFGKAMLDDATLRPEFDELTGQAPTKPFECVGTVDEVRQALLMAVERWYGDHRPTLLQGAVPAAPESWIDVTRPGGQANLSDSEYQILTQACTAKNN